MDTSLAGKSLLYCAVLAFGPCIPIMAQEAEIAPPPPGVAAGVNGDYEVMTRGHLHEAFATPTTFDPVEQPIIQKHPPELIDEVLPDHRPAGENVIWIPGYWAYEQDQEDFIWISGLWRNVPPGRQWVPGYWHEASGGYQWVAGTWVRADGPVSFYPEPPQSQERGPSSVAPSADHFYIPGCWVYQDNRYGWRPGYWAPYQRGWVWIPARYTRAARGYVYSDGYWDYPFERRGQVFAPVRFRNQVYANAGFRFAPQAIIDSNVRLMLHLFVRPDRGAYVFGDYYGGGATPWFEYGRSDRGYDPLFTYYQWHSGPEFGNRIQGWHKYFDSHPDYRPRPTLTEQLAFTNAHQDFQYLGQAVLGDTLEKLVSTRGDTNRFVPLEPGQRESLTGVTNQIRELTGERLRLESAASADVNATTNQSSRLPTDKLNLPALPGIRVPEVGREVPDIPSNLQNVTPQAPRVPRGRDLPTPNVPRNLPGNLPRDLPLDLPRLPF